MSAPVAQYAYQRPTGELAYTIRRWTNPKRFTTVGGTDGERYPFQLPRLLDVALCGGCAFVVEGERDVFSLLDTFDVDGWDRNEWTATTSAHGASWVWPDEWADYFRGLERVYVIADNDEPGRKCALQRATVIAGAVETVTVLGMLPGAVDHGDVTDYLDDGGSLSGLVSLCDGAPVIMRHEVGGEVPTLGEFLAAAEHEPEYDWLVPGRIERGDRIVVTGDEGYGKSTLLQQVAVGAAMGVDTLAFGEPIRHAPLRVLFIDLENARRQLQRGFAKVLRAVPEADRATVLARTFVHVESAGMVLDNLRDPDRDREAVKRLCVLAKPDVLVIGPLYKMMGGDPNDEHTSRDLAKWLDYLRDEYKCAVVIEAHAPHGQKRVYGWSGWKRWPEYGLHLGADGVLSHWRGQRDERSWPRALVRGAAPGWLWVPSTVAPTNDNPEEREAREADLSVLRALRQARRPLTRTGIIERTGRRRVEVLAAIARLCDNGSLIVRHTEGIRTDGRRYHVAVYTRAAHLIADDEPPPRADDDDDTDTLASVTSLFDEPDDDDEPNDGE